MKNKVIILQMLLWLFSSSAWATTVILNDGDVFDYDPANDYQSSHQFTYLGEVVNYGVNINPGEAFDWTVNPQSNALLATVVTTAPEDGSGILIGTVIHNAVFLSDAANAAYFGTWIGLPVSTSAIFPINGNDYIGQTQWLSIVAIDFLPVPVPAAFWLFGSGLLGLIGISRRKKTA